MTGRPPSLSIITPSYNYARYLPDALASIRLQAVGVEHIVVDGGSTDETCDLLNDAGPAVRWISEPDRGQSDALNKALHMAQGDWIGWLNVDEFYLPWAFAAFYDAIASNPSGDVVYGEAAFVDENGRHIRLVAQHRFSSFVLRYYGCFIPTCATFVRRSALGDFRFDLELKRVMDWDLFLHLAKRGSRFVHIAKPLAAYRVHDDQVTATAPPPGYPERARLGERFEFRTEGHRAEALRRIARLQHGVAKILNGARRREAILAAMSGECLRWFDGTDLRPSRALVGASGDPAQARPDA